MWSLLICVANQIRKPGGGREHQRRRRPCESVHSITSLVGARVIPGPAEDETLDL